MNEVCISALWLVNFQSVVSMFVDYWSQNLYLITQFNNELFNFLKKFGVDHTSLSFNESSIILCYN